MSKKQTKDKVASPTTKRSKRASKRASKTIYLSSESADLYTSKRLLIESQKLNYSPIWLNPYEHHISLNNPPNSPFLEGLYLHRTSGTRYDNHDLLVAKYYQELGLKITNPLEALNLFRNKDEQALFFHRHQLMGPETIIYRGALTPQCWEDIRGVSKNEKYILKMNRGNQGIGVNLIQGVQSLKSLLETFHALRDQKFIIQPFVEHKKEWRLFFLKNELMATIERTLGSGDFRGNSKRSSGKLVKKIPSELLALALKSAQVSGLDYCGIDIIENGDQFLILEINPVPGFLQVEELSAINIARELIKNLV